MREECPEENHSLVLRSWVKVKVVTVHDHEPFEMLELHSEPPQIVMS